MERIMPDVPSINAAYERVRRADTSAPRFRAQGSEYRLTHMPDEPMLAWDVWVSELGDIVVKKPENADLVRPAQTQNEGYRCISILKAAPTGDPYLRRRVHEWVARAFFGAPPTPSAVVEHLDDDSGNNAAQNLAWSTHALNRARRHVNDRTGIVPPTKLRKIPVSARVIRAVKEHTGKKGRQLSAYVEALICRDLGLPTHMHMPSPQ